MCKIKEKRKITGTAVQPCSESGLDPGSLSYFDLHHVIIAYPLADVTASQNNLPVYASSMDRQARVQADSSRFFRLVPVLLLEVLSTEPGGMPVLRRLPVAVS